MVTANSPSWSYSRNIKEYQRDSRFIHFQNGYIHHSSKINFVLKRRKNPVMTDHQAQLFSLDHRFPQCFKNRASAKTNKTKSDFNRWTPRAQPAKCHHSTFLSISLTHAFADNNLSMPNMNSKAFYLLLVTVLLLLLLLLLLVLLPAGAGENRRQMALQTSYHKSDSTLRESVLCKLKFLFLPGSPETPLYMSNWGLKITKFISNLYGSILEKMKQ